MFNQKEEEEEERKEKKTGDNKREMSPENKLASNQQIHAARANEDTHATHVQTDKHGHRETYVVVVAGD